MTADGWPVVWLLEKQHRANRAKFDGQPERRQVERTTGADLLAPMCQLSAENGYSLYFVGPSPQSQADGIKILQNRHAGLKVAGAEAPKLPAELEQESIDGMAQRINASGAAVCVLSLGAPKQELLADALHKQCPGVGFICVGAALDFISGHAKRAPGWTQRLKLEWFWRLASDPVRLTSRYALCALALLKLALPAVFPGTPRLRMQEAANPAAEPY